MKKLTVWIVTALTIFAGNLLPLNEAIADSNLKLVTCTNLISPTQRISHLGNCRPSIEAQANWHLLQADSIIPDSSNLQTITICSNQSQSKYKYSMIRKRCTAIQKRTDYYRSNLLNQPPVITKVVALGSSAVQISISPDMNSNLDAPIAYYTITSSKGDQRKILNTNTFNLTIDNLQPETSYSFKVSATSVDGTSKESEASAAIDTYKYVAPVVANNLSTPTATIDLVSSDTAVVTIPIGATNVTVSAPSLGNPSLSFSTQGTSISATITSIGIPTNESSTPFTVTGSTKIIDISFTGLSGSATLCLDASPSARLWHFVGGAWVDITTSHTSSQVCGLTSSFSPFVSEEQLSPPTFTLSSNSRIATQGRAFTPITASKVGHLQVVTYSISPALPDGLSIDTLTGTISGTPASLSSSSDYVISAINAALVTETQTVNITVNPLVPCSISSDCVLGDIGPGGGIIFYVSTAGFKCGATWSTTGSPTGSLCHYLEVAPKNWSGGSSDPRRPARVNATTTDIAEIPNNYTNGTGRQTRSGDTANFDYLDTSQLGAGLLFSNLINQTDSGATAARLARSYTPTSGVSDYYLPTLTELNLLCQWSKGITQVVDTQCGTGSVREDSGLGGSNSDYWSSSDKFAHSNGQFEGWVLAIDLANAAYGPGTESFGPYTSESWSVRPIRAF